MEVEIKPVVGYEGHYSVTNAGDVLTHKGGVTRAMKPDTDPTGYHRVNLCKDGVKKAHRVHRLVAEAFHPDRPETHNIVNHLNGVKTCNTSINLEWTTIFGNVQHAKATGLIGKSVALRGSKHPCSKLTEEKVNLIRKRRYEDGDTISEIAEEFGIAKPTVIHICLRRTWTHI